MMLKVIYEGAAQSQLESIAEFVESKNTTGSGLRWLEQFYDFIEPYAQPNLKYALCSDKEFALQKFSCIVFRKKWIIAFKISSSKFTVHHIVLGSLLH